MKKILVALLLLGIFSHPLLAQQNKRVMNTDQPVYQRSSFSEIQTIRIESGKLWIDGNLIAAEELPVALQNINPNYRFEASLFGGNEFKFSLFGKDYLLKHGTIVEISPPNLSLIQSSSNYKKQDYYSNLKNETPDLFSALAEEARLHENCMQLVLDHNIANDHDKEILRVEIQNLLEDMFDLQISTRYEEIKQLEREMNAVKNEMEFRKKNRNVIIDNRMNDLKVK